MARFDALEPTDVHRLARAEQRCAAYLSEHFEDIHIELVGDAKVLVRECQDLISGDFKERKQRRPPLALSCKVRSNQLGPTLVWLRYAITDASNVSGHRRFGTEVPGRRNHLYQPRIFRPFKDKALIERLVEIESRASELRRRTSRWRAIQTAVRQFEQG